MGRCGWLCAWLGGSLLAATSGCGHRASTVMAFPPSLPEMSPRGEADRRGTAQALQSPVAIDSKSLLENGLPQIPRAGVHWRNLPGLEGSTDITEMLPAMALPETAVVPPATPPPSVVQKPLADDTLTTADVVGQGTIVMDQTDQGRSSVDESDTDRAGPEVDRLSGLIVDMSREAYRRAAYSEMPLRELILIAATSVVTPDRAIDPEAIPSLTVRERELLGLMQTFYTSLGQELGDTGDAEVIVAAVASLNRSLTVEPELRVARAVLCTRVGGYGDYDEFPRNEAGRYTFLADSSQQVVVYVEVEEFTSELDDDGQWVTELAQQLTVYNDRDGIPVWGDGTWQVGIDRTRNRREDFFVGQLITIPERLSVGLYQLKVRLRDEQSRAEAEAAIDFEMVADPALVGLSIP